MICRYENVLFSFFTLAVVITLASCQSDDDISLNLSNIQLQSIEECVSDNETSSACTSHTFLYDNGILQAIDSEQFIYDEYGTLVGTRVHEMDTTFRYKCVSDDCEPTDQVLSIKETLEKYSYHWEDNHVVSRTLDTIMIKTIVDGVTTDVALQTYLPSAEYYYSGDILDSVSYWHPISRVNIRKIVFKYDVVGNITALNEYYRTTPYPFVRAPMVPASPYSEVVTEFLRYDDKPNPYYAMFKQYGVMLNKVEGRNISKNNPMEAISRIKYNGDWLEAYHTYEYEYYYGLPSTVYLDRGMTSEVTTKITYN